MTTASTWRAFTDEEIRVIFDALTSDDGIRYGVERNDQPTYGLVCSLIEAARMRGFDQDLDWDAVVDASDLFKDSADQA